MHLTRENGVPIPVETIRSGLLADIDRLIEAEAAKPQGSSFRGNADPADSLDALRTALVDLAAAVECVPYHRHPRGGPCGYPDEGHREYSCPVCLALAQAAALVGEQPPAGFVEGRPFTPPELPPWPTKYDLAAMSAAEVNEFFATQGVSWRVRDDYEPNSGTWRSSVIARVARRSRSRWPRSEAGSSLAAPSRCSTSAAAPAWKNPREVPMTPDAPRTDPLRIFGHAVGLALAGRKVPDGVDVEHMTPAQMLEATCVLLDRLDDATDEYLSSKGTDHRIDRAMQRSLRALAAETRHSHAYEDRRMGAPFYGDTMQAGCSCGWVGSDKAVWQKHRDSIPPADSLDALRAALTELLNSLPPMPRTERMRHAENDAWAALPAEGSSKPEPTSEAAAIAQWERDEGRRRAEGRRAVVGRDTTRLSGAEGSSKPEERQR
jgi:hypothetical protein